MKKRIYILSAVLFVGSTVAISWVQVATWREFRHVENEKYGNFYNRAMFDSVDVNKDTVIREAAAHPRAARKLIRGAVKHPRATRKILKGAVNHPGAAKKVIRGAVKHPKARKILRGAVKHPRATRKVIKALKNR